MAAKRESPNKNIEKVKAVCELLLILLLLECNVYGLLMNIQCKHPVRQKNEYASLERTHAKITKSHELHKVHTNLT